MKGPWRGGPLASRTRAFSTPLPLAAGISAWVLGAFLLAACQGVPPGDRALERAGDAATDAAPGFPRLVRDDAGREVRIPAPPERILSLVPSATPVLMALGQADRLVGRTDFDRQPELSELPSVGGGLGPSIERIVSLRPDLVIRFDAGSDPGTPRQLDRAGILHLAIRPDGIADVLRIIDLLGGSVAQETLADSLRTTLRTELESVEARVAGTSRPRVAILLGGDPPLVAGEGTFLHELAELAGASNVLADAGTLYAPVSVETILNRSPEALLVSEGAVVPRGLEGLPVHELPLEVQIPGLDLGASAQLLAGLLHPDRRP